MSLGPALRDRRRLPSRMGEALGVPVTGTPEEARRQIIAALTERIHAMDLDRARRVVDPDEDGLL
jgi:hypothetical protein